MSLTTAYALSATLMFLLPILLGFFLARKFGLSWRLFLFGGLAFILAQLIHLPLNALLSRAMSGLGVEANIWVQALALGFTAAITEEFARYAILRNNLKNARSWKKALMFGAGHGGFEAMILAILLAFTLANMIAIKNNPAALDALPADKIAAVQQQAAEFWSVSWSVALLGVVERASALAIQVALAVMVMQVFLRKSVNWLWLAVAWHWLVDAISVLSAKTFSIPITELVVGVLAITSLMIILLLRPTHPDNPDPPTPPEPLSDSLATLQDDFAP